MRRFSQKAVAVVMFSLALGGVTVPAAQAGTSDVWIVECAKVDGTKANSEWGTAREASTSALDCVKGGGEATVFLKEFS